MRQEKGKNGCLRFKNYCEVVLKKDNEDEIFDSCAFGLFTVLV